MKRSGPDPFSCVAVTGSQGQVGRRLVEKLQRRDPSTEVISLTRNDFDLSDPDGIQARLDELKPTLVFHAGAYTQVDRAESERELSATVNRDATREIGRWCLKNEVPLVFFSTDYIFSGDAEFPYTPDSPKKPVNWYGQTKSDAEDDLVKLGLHCLVIRTQWVYDSRGKNFLLTILKLLAERPQVSVVSDQIGSPTFAPDLAGAAIELAEFWLAWDNPGMLIRNVTNAEYTTWYQFAESIREGAVRRGLLKSPGELLSIRTTEYPTAAARPLRNALDLRETLREGVSLRSWKTALDDCLDEIAQKNEKERSRK